MLNLYQYHTQPQTLAHYEEARTSVPEIAWDFIPNREKPKYEHLWAQDARLAHDYSGFVLKGRFPAGEPAIAQDATYACSYARLLRAPWSEFNPKLAPQAEASIATNANQSYFYAEFVLERPWPPGERAISKKADISYSYARETLKGPFPAGERAMARDPRYALYYAQDVLKLPLDQARTWGQEYLDKHPNA